jgi:hypothetical protein
MLLVDSLMRLLVFTVALACAGCASTPADMEDLNDAPATVVFSLADGVQIRGGTQSIHLAGGNYRVVKQNRHGSMVAAPEFGVIRPSPRGFLGFQGGIWLPKDPSANARIYVLYETSERLYPNLQTALTVPADAERKILEASGEPVDSGKSPSVPAPGSPNFQYGNIAHSPAAALVMGIADSQRGKPDVIVELSQTELHQLLKSSLSVQR